MAVEMYHSMGVALSFPARFATTEMGRGVVVRCRAGDGLREGEGCAAGAGLGDGCWDGRGVGDGVGVTLRRLK